MDGMGLAARPWEPRRRGLEGGKTRWTGRYCRTGLGRGTSYAVPTGGESMYHPAAITALEYLQAEVTLWADGR